MNPLVEKIMRYQDASGMSQAEMARRIGITSSTYINHVKRGRKPFGYTLGFYRRYYDENKEAIEAVTEGVTT